MEEIIIIEKLTADAMKSVVGGDMRSLATSWETGSPDPNGTPAGGG